MTELSTLRHQVALWYTPSIGTSTFCAICDKFPNLNDFFANPLKHADKFNLSPAARDYLVHPNWQDIDTAVMWQEQANQHIITLDHPAYPQQLSNISGPPAMLFIKGDINCLNDPQLAIVGSRFASPYGRDNAINFAREMAQSGITVTSGMALGLILQLIRGH